MNYLFKVPCKIFSQALYQTLEQPTKLLPSEKRAKLHQFLVQPNSLFLYNVYVSVFQYDLLEEDFVKTKARLVQEKELAESNLAKVRKEHNELSFECNSLKESYNTRQDAWIKEKLELQVHYLLISLICITLIEIQKGGLINLNNI